MSRTTLSLDGALREYMLSVSVRETEILRRLRAETAAMNEASMQISPEQGALLALLVELSGARRALEVGVFTGYSALRVALALPAAGMLTACEVSRSYAEVARRYWIEAGVAGKIDLRLAPALETLDALLTEGRHESYDFAFIDADKPNYVAYYERALQLLRPGGLVAVDNVLWGGAVVDPERTDADTQAIRALNARVRDDQRVSVSLVPIGDGLMLACRRP